MGLKSAGNSVKSLLVFGVFIFFGCKLAVEDINGDRRFWARDTYQNTYYEVDALKLAEGEHCIVYAETSQGIDEATAANAASHFDKIYKKMVVTFGSPDILDVDGNGKVIMLLLDIKDASYYNGASGYTGGFFDPNMLYAKKSFPYSNECDMFFLDTNPGRIDPDPTTVSSRNAYSTAAHEFQHLLSFAASVKHRGGAAQDTWINEGLSTAAEYLYEEDLVAANGGIIGDGQNQTTAGDPNNRLRYYNMATGGIYKLYGMTTGKNVNTNILGNNFFVWDSDDLSKVLVDYATDYIFFQWLRIHAEGDTSIYTRIVNSSWTNFKAVVEAAKNENIKDTDFDLSGVAINRESSNEGEWQRIMEKWMWANYYNSTSEGTLLGYKGKLTIYPYIYDSADWWSYSGDAAIHSVSSETPQAGRGLIHPVSVPLKGGEAIYTTYKTDAGFILPIRKCAAPLNPVGVSQSELPSLVINTDFGANANYSVSSGTIASFVEVSERSFPTLSQSAARAANSASASNGGITGVNDSGITGGSGEKWVIDACVPLEVPPGTEFVNKGASNK